MKYVLVDGGMVSMEGGSPEYVFFLVDHLGSTRVAATEDGGVLQVNHYYPYGASYASSRMATGSVPGVDAVMSASQPYRFLGNELLVDAGMDVYDFHARMYDPVLGRFLSVDPLAEKYYSVSPYAYCAGNPVMYVDPDGMANWRVVMKGIKMAAVGAGGVAVYGSVSSTCIGAFLGAVGLVDSISSFGLGVTYAITGLLLDADDDKGILDAPESLTNAVAKSIEKIAGTEDQKIEGAMNMLMGLTDLPNADKLIGSIDLDTAKSVFLFLYQEISGGWQLYNSFNNDGK